MRPKTLLTGFCLLLAAGFAPTAIPARAAVSAKAAQSTVSCAWYEATVATDNQGTPDSAAAYWLTPFTAQAGMRIVLSGQYPDARYASLEVTKPGGGLFTVDGVSSEVTDYRIAPDLGSVNPWQRQSRAGGRFTVTVQSDVAPGQANTLPLSPAGSGTGTSYLIYRVYLPAGGDFARVPLPAVTVISDGVSERLPGCPASPATAPAASATVSSASTVSAQAGGLEFARPPAGSGSGLSPNADTGYLAAVVTPPSGGNVIVIRAKAPTTPRGSRPLPWPALGIDTRYWSMCVYLDTALTPLVANDLPGGRVDYGCRHDSRTALDRYGYYTYVVGTEAQRGAIGRVPGTTFLPFSAAQPSTPQIFLLRNMLVAPGFVVDQNVPQNGSPASAAPVMGAYYPRAVICPLATSPVAGPGPASASQQVSHREPDST